MSAEPVIDGFEFAESGRTLRGSVPLSGFPRLRDMLAGPQGELQYAVAGIRDVKGRWALRITVAGLLPVRCQRCLDVLELPVDIDATLVLARSENELKVEPLEVDAADWVLAGKEMKIFELLEDELLLAVPYAPRHERCGNGNGRLAADPRTSPFAGLRGMISGSQKGKQQG